MTSAAPSDGAVTVSLDASAVPVRPAGAGQYTIALARALLERSDVRPTFLVRRGDTARWRALVEDAGTGAGAAPVLGVVPEPRPARLVFERLAMGGVAQRAGVSVHHGPHYTMPGGRIPPRVVTVHDCTYFDHPEWHERSKVLLFRRAIRRAAARAAVVVCVSEHTATRLAEVVDISARVVVAPHGVDHERFRTLEVEPGADRRLLAGIGVDPDRPFVVFVGTVEPRKDVGRLVDAFDRVAAAHPDAVLVIAGQPGWGGDAVGQALARARHESRVVRTGYVPDAAVPALLRSATTVAYPSLSEGYGLPALEALACGAPLVTTSGTAMAELAGPAAVVVPPADTDALSAALEAALSAGPGDPGRAQRRRLGLDLASGYTWEASAALHVTAYRIAAGLV